MLVLRTKNEEKRQEIVNAAISLLSEKGYYKTSIKDISDMAHMSSGTFYLYYKSKDDLILDIYHEVHEILGKYLNEKMELSYSSPEERLVAVSCFLVSKYLENKKLSVILLTRTIGINRHAENEYFNTFSKAVANFAGLIQKIPQADYMDIRLTATFYVQAMGVAATKWMLADPSTRPDFYEVVFMTLRYHLRALAIEIPDTKLREYISKYVTVTE